MEDRNFITDELIAEARSDWRDRVRVKAGTVDGFYRKPIKRLGAWYIRDGGFRLLRSFCRTRLGNYTLITFSTDWHYYGFSRHVKNEGELPVWFDHDIHDVCFASYKAGEAHLWGNVTTYYIQARYECDIPADYQDREDAA